MRLKLTEHQIEMALLELAVLQTINALRDTVLMGYRTTVSSDDHYIYLTIYGLGNTRFVNYVFVANNLIEYDPIKPHITKCINAMLYQLMLDEEGERSNG